MRTRLFLLLFSILLLGTAGVFLEGCSAVYGAGDERRMVLSRF